MNDSRPLIAHVIFRLDVGGMENGLVNLINNMPTSRYRHAIICLDDYTEFSERITTPDVAIIALHKQPGNDPGIYLRLWRVFRQLRPAVVHTRNLGTVDAVLPAAAAGVGCRVHGEHGWDVVDLHGKNVSYRYLRRICGWLTARHIAVSAHLASWLHEAIGVPTRKITHICNGVDTEKFSPASGGRAELPDTTFAPADCLIIGMVGRIAAVKNPMALVRAFLYLLENVDNGRQKLRLVMIGDGPLLEGVRDALRAADALELAWLPGARNDVADLLKCMDVFVVPSLNEGISNTVLEAMATGLPVVATAVGGNPELVQSGRSGCLVEVNDHVALAAAIETYLEHPEIRKQHGEAGRAAAERDFSLTTMVRRYLDVYDSTLGANAQVPAR